MERGRDCGGPSRSGGPPSRLTIDVVGRSEPGAARVCKRDIDQGWRDTLYVSNKLRGNNFQKNFISTPAHVVRCVESQS